MNDWNQIEICECCMLWFVNRDDSSCRHYFGHDHATPHSDHDIIVDTDKEPEQYGGSSQCPTCKQLIGGMGNWYNAYIL